MRKQQKREFKIVVVGDSGVGKTILVKRLFGEPFDPKFISTCGASVHLLTCEKGDLDIWDCAGNERFRGLDDQYYRNSDLALICFSVDSTVTLQHCKDWFKKVLNAGLKPKKCILVGIKSDIDPKPDIYNILDANFKGVKFLKVSNKEKRSVDELFNCIKDILGK